MSGASYFLSKSALSFFQNTESQFNLEHVSDIEVLNTVYYLKKIRDKLKSSKPINCPKGHHWSYVMNTSGSTNTGARMVFVPYQCIEPNINSLRYDSLNDSQQKFLTIV